MAKRTKRMTKTARTYAPILTAGAAMLGAAAAAAGRHKYQDDEITMDWKDAAAAMGAGVAGLVGYKMLTDNKGWVKT